MILPSWNRTIKPALQKAVAIQSRPTEESFPELPDVLVWMRAALALAYGVYAGYYHQVRGAAAIFQALNVVTFVPYAYCRFFLGTPYTGVFDMHILFGGTPQALCLFLLVWIYFFTAAHAPDEARLSELLVEVLAPDDNGGLDNATSTADAAAGPGDAAGSEF